MGQKVSKNTNYSIYVYGHKFFGHNSAIFWPIRLKFIMVSQETIIYRLYIKKLGFKPFFDFSSFWALLGPEKGRGPTDTHIGLGPLVDPLGHMLSQNYVSNFFDLGPTLNCLNWFLMSIIK